MSIIDSTDMPTSSPHARPPDAHLRLAQDIPQVMCQELKHLYVAVTRAKHRLYFFDSNEKGLPWYKLMEDMLELVEPVRERKLQYAVARRSLARDYIRRGEANMQDGQFETAMRCFAEAHRAKPDEAYVAKEQQATAHFFAAKADVEEDQALRTSLYLKAALLFLRCGDAESASRHLRLIEDERANELLLAIRSA